MSPRRDTPALCRLRVLTTISLCLLFLGGIFDSRIPFDVFVTIVFQRSVLPPRTVAVVRSSQSRGKPSSRNHGEDICHDSCHAKFVALTAGHQLPLTHRTLTVPRYQTLRVLNKLCGRSSTSIDPSCTHSSTISNITCFEQAIFVLLFEA